MTEETRSSKTIRLNKPVLYAVLFCIAFIIVSAVGTKIVIDRMSKAYREAYEDREELILKIAAEQCSDYSDSNPSANGKACVCQCAEDSLDPQDADTEIFVEVGQRFAKAHTYVNQTEAELLGIPLFTCSNASTLSYFLFKNIGYNVSLMNGCVESVCDRAHGWIQLCDSKGCRDFEPLTGEFVNYTEKYPYRGYKAWPEVQV